MEPKFKCSYCGAERIRRLSPDAITVIGKLFKDTDCPYLDHTFCDIGCLMAYIAEWKEQHD